MRAQYNLHPTYTPAQIEALDAEPRVGEALDGQAFLPGTVGLNNINGETDYINVVLQALNRVCPLRDFFLDAARYRDVDSRLVQCFGELVRKMWNPRAYKGQVSPHELLQAILEASGQRFTAKRQADPVEFLTWFLNALHLALTRRKPKKASVVTRCFQGRLEITSLRTGETRESPFLMLALDLPPAPVFQDEMEKIVIPQVPLHALLQKYDGRTVHDHLKFGQRTFRVTQLPRFLVLHVARFTRNNFFVEKDPTIVTFPIKHLQLGDCIPVPAGEGAGGSRYDLVANVSHEGKPEAGKYRVHVANRAAGTWHEMQDLVVTETLPQVVPLAESYLQVFQREDAS